LRDRGRRRVAQEEPNDRPQQSDHNDADTNEQQLVTGAARLWSRSRRHRESTTAKRISKSTAATAAAAAIIG